MISSNTISTTTEEQKVIIIGAGVAGLALANGLKKLNIPFKLFEKGPRDSHRQGYRLRINPDGSEALKKILGDDVWQLFVKSCADMKFGMTQIDAITGEIKSRSQTFTKQKGSSDMVFTADRTTLRHVLMNGLTDDEIEFNKSFESYEIINGNTVNVKFSDDTTITGSLLIGADGIRSNVRKQFLPNLKFFDTNGRICYGKTPITNSLLPNIPASIMECTTLISTNEEAPLSLFLEPIRFKVEQPDKQQQQQEGSNQSSLPKVDDYIYWVLLSQSEKFLKSDSEMYKMESQELKDYLLTLTSNWSPLLKNVIAYSDVEKTSFFPIVSSSSDIAKWETSKHITLLGDSVHPMPPTGGVGANSALVDALYLTEAIKNGASISDLNQYESKMRAFSKESIIGSISGAKRMFGFKSLENCKFIDL